MDDGQILSWCFLFCNIKKTQIIKLNNPCTQILLKMSYMNATSIAQIFIDIFKNCLFKVIFGYFSIDNTVEVN
jgi:hypothetical protein